MKSSKSSTPERLKAILRGLARSYGDAHCALVHSNVLELLVAQKDLPVAPRVHQLRPARVLAPGGDPDVVGAGRPGRQHPPALLDEQLFLDDHVVAEVFEERIRRKLGHPAAPCLVFGPHTLHQEPVEVGGVDGVDLRGRQFLQPLHQGHELRFRAVRNERREGQGR